MIVKIKNSALVLCIVALYIHNAHAAAPAAGAGAFKQFQEQRVCMAGNISAPAKGNIDQSKKLSALEELYTQKFPQGHLKEWKAISEPFTVKPTKIDLPIGIRKMFFVNNGKTLITLSYDIVQRVDIGEKTIKTFHDTWPKEWTDHKLTTYRFSHIAALTCDSTGTKLAALLEYDRLYPSSLVSFMHVGSLFKIKMYEISSMEPIDRFVGDKEILMIHRSDDVYYTLSWPSKSLNPQHVELPKQAGHVVDESYPIVWDYKPMRIPIGATFSEYGRIKRYADSEIYDATTGCVMYKLQEPGTPDIIAWNHDGTQLATTSKDTNTIYLWDLKKYNQFLKGDVTPEQAMVICALAEQSMQFRKTYPLCDVPCSLKDCARRIQALGITTATLANALLTLDPAIRTALMKHYTISSKRLLAHDDPEQKKYREKSKRAEQVGVTPPQDDPQYDYLQACEAFNVARAMVIPQEYDTQKAADIAAVLEEYAVEESPQVNRPNPVDDAIEKTRILQDLGYRAETTKKLFAAIAGRDIKAFNEHLNPVSVGDRHPDMRGRTPLMHALACYDPNNPASREMVKRLLDYEESLILNKSVRETRTSDLGATDAEGNLPVMFVQNIGDLHLVLKILLKMKINPLLHATLEKIKKNPRYQELMKVSMVLEECGE